MLLKYLIEYTNKEKNLNIMMFSRKKAKSIAYPVNNLQFTRTVKKVANKFHS